MDAFFSRPLENLVAMKSAATIKTGPMAKMVPFESPLIMQGV